MLRGGEALSLSAIDGEVKQKLGMLLVPEEQPNRLDPEQ